MRGHLGTLSLVDTDDTRLNMSDYTGMGGVQGVYVLPHKTYPTALPETLPPATSCPVSTSVSYAGVMDATTSATTSKCWAIRCTGVLRMTYRNMLSLRNTQGYELDSLGDHRDVYEADYPADGTLTLVFTKVLNGSFRNYRSRCFGPRVLRFLRLIASLCWAIAPVVQSYVFCCHRFAVLGIETHFIQTSVFCSHHFRWFRMDGSSGWIPQTEIHKVRATQAHTFS